MLYLVLVFLPFQVQSGHWNTAKGNLALDGYDPVSYFEEQGPDPGKAEYLIEYQGLKFQFKNQENLQVFEKNPAKYLPEYGGWCAYAMGESGDKVRIDPETFKIVEGKLYLFYNFRGYNTLTDWNKNEDDLRQKANQYWQRIIKS